MVFTVHLIHAEDSLRENGHCKSCIGCQILYSLVRSLFFVLPSISSWLIRILPLICSCRCSCVEVRFLILNGEVRCDENGWRGGC